MQSNILTIGIHPNLEICFCFMDTIPWSTKPINCKANLNTKCLLIGFCYKLLIQNYTFYVWQGWRNRGCTGCTCTPSFFGERTKTSSQMFPPFEFYAIVHPQFLALSAIPVPYWQNSYDSNPKFDLKKKMHFNSVCWKFDLNPIIN